MNATRFAPSPTGPLHLGHAYAALVAREAARRHQGRFLLRFEDIDRPRVRDEYYEAARRDLRWLGLDWDPPETRQLDRLDAYARALEALRRRDLVYPCFCSRREIQRELDQLAAAPHGPEGPLYPGTCRQLDPAERRRRLAAGETPSWRLDAAGAADRAGPLVFVDLEHGRHPVDPTLLGDVVLARKDIGTSYHLAVVVDDAWQEIGLVTRGEDLLPSTHVHRLLQALLELPAPRYLHHTLVTDEHGRRLAKRDEARALATLREAGQSPAAVLAMLPPLPGALR